MNNAGIIDAMTFNANGNPTMKGRYEQTYFFFPCLLRWRSILFCSFSFMVR